MNFRASKNDQVDVSKEDASLETSPSRTGATKFVYRSGERPLKGYSIKRGVGRGGFGEVYFATSDAGKEVALKLIRRNLEVELRGVTQCLNLKHPNLIDLYDIRADDEGDQWVIMEYVSGESLDEVMDRHPNGLPIDQAMWWMRGICAGVAYLHDHGIVHRDLKPGNIFSEGGYVKVGDYGLAKFISCSRRSGQTESVGTVHYMAPEISNGRYGREIDTYALGIMLYELLTGSVPFEGESIGEVLMKHLTAEPELDKLEQPYRDIVHRALAKDPEVRINTVGELMSLLPGGNTPNATVNNPIPIGKVASATDGISSPNTNQNAPEGSLESDPHAEFAHENEEPIYAALRDGWMLCERAWHEANLHPVLRGMIIVGTVFMLITTVPEWLTVLFTAFIIYGIYYAVRGLLIQVGGTHSDRSNTGHSKNQAAAAMAPEQNTAHPPRNIHPQRRRRRKNKWRDLAAAELVNRPLRDKLSELLGTMLLSSFVALLVGMVALVLGGSWNLHLWLTIVGTLGSWAVLIPTKFAEGKIEDHIPMRLILMVLGALVGAVAFGLAHFMLDGLPLNYEFGNSPNEAIGTKVLGMGSRGTIPSLAAFMAYFGFLFAIVRWWRQAEFIRHRRLGVWSVAVCIFWAYCLHFFWWFPQPAGMMVAGVVAISTQLASPWMPPSRRRKLVEQAEAV